MEYSEILRQILIENDYSQEEMAKILGVNQTTVSQWLLGKKKPGFDSILQIYRCFGITPNQLLGVEE